MNTNAEDNAEPAPPKKKGRTGRIENLTSNIGRTPEQLRERARKGGLASAKKKRAKMLLSAIYAEMLDDLYTVGLGEKGKKKLTIDNVVQAILERGDSASVSLLKEFREATEGSKTQLTGPDGGPIQVAKIERVIIDVQNAKH